VIQKSQPCSSPFYLKRLDNEGVGAVEHLFARDDARVVDKNVNVAKLEGRGGGMVLIPEATGSSQLHSEEFPDAWPPPPPRRPSRCCTQARGQ
jgi:hypothetical protein